MLTFRRFYHVTATAYNIKKLGVKLNKMVNPRAKRLCFGSAYSFEDRTNQFYRKAIDAISSTKFLVSYLENDTSQWYPTHMETDIMPSVKSLTKTQNEPGKRSVRRAAMLNKMFMKQITDLMSTGTVSMNIVGRGIEISKVKITPDLQSVHVFWVCKGDSSDEETEAVLNKIAGPLRHELSTLRVMGEVPYVVFVKDRQEAQIVDLDRRLAVADYGEDYSPTDMGHLLKSEFTLNTKLSPEVQAKIRRLDEDEPPIEEPIPDMSNNVFGLDHENIMNRLLAARKKSRDAWSRLEGPRDDVIAHRDDVISYRTGDGRAETSDVTNHRKELAEFLLKRKILQNKIYKELRASSEEWQLEEPDPGEDSDGYYDGYNCDDDDDVYQHDYKINKDKHS